MDNQRRGELQQGPVHDSWAYARNVIGDGMLSVLMPAYNLGGSIAPNVLEVRDLLKGEVPFEVVVVDDGSTDDTRPELERLAADGPEIHPLFLPRNRGKGHAILEGYGQCRGSHILFLDADLDLPPRQAARFFDIMHRTGADIVIGSKRHPASRLHYPWQRRVASALYFFLVKLLIGLPLHDTQTGITLFKRAALECAVPRMKVKGFAFDLELLVLADRGGFRTAESPVELIFKSDALGCFRPSTVKQTLKDTLAIFWRLRVKKSYRFEG